MQRHAAQDHSQYTHPTPNLSSASTPALRQAQPAPPPRDDSLRGSSTQRGKSYSSDSGVDSGSQSAISSASSSSSAVSQSSSGNLNQLEASTSNPTSPEQHPMQSRTPVSHLQRLLICFERVRNVCNMFRFTGTERHSVVCVLQATNRIIMVEL